MLAAIEGPDLLIVIAIVLLLFGGKRLPELARGLSEAKREYRYAAGSSGAESPAGDAPASGC